MNNNRILLVIFILLGTASAWYLYRNLQGSDTALGWDRKFKVENPEEIGKIFLAKRTGETTTIERNGNEWKVNGRYKASPNAVENLLEAVTQVELKFVPPVKAVENFGRELAARGIKVEVYDRRNRLLKAYYVGGVTQDARGTVMLMENSDQPMVVEIPQMEGQIRTRYDLTGDKWRDRTVFGYQDPDRIRQVSVAYPQQRNKSFVLDKEAGRYSVRPFYDNVPPLDRPVSPASAEAYLFQFRSLMAEAFENNMTGKDSIRQTVPFAVISVTDDQGSVRTATLFPTYRNDAFSGERPTDIVERYYADLNTGDWMLVQHHVFQKIFWPYESLLEPPGNDLKN